MIPRNTAIRTTLAFVLVAKAAAQVASTVTCSSDSIWMQNSKGQNPCTVVAWLSSVCNNGVWTVPPLAALNQAYDPPSGSFANTCRCNTVVYSLIEACATCQGGTVIPSFGNWTALCQPSDVHSSYPNSVPGQTAIPGWAYLDPTLTGGGTWNATAAEAYAAASDSNGSNSGSKKKAPIGAIVGGVIGGIALLAFAAWAIWFAIQRSPSGKGMRVRPATHSDAGLTETVRDDAGEPATKYRVDMSTSVPLMSAYYTPESGSTLAPTRPSTTVPYGGDHLHYPNYAVTPGYPSTSQAYPPYHPPQPYPQQHTPPTQSYPQAIPPPPQQMPPSAFPQNHITGAGTSQQVRPFSTRRLSGGYTGVAEI